MARAAKDGKRGALELVVRAISAYVQKRPQTTDEQRAGLGIRILDKEKTPLNPETILHVEPPRMLLDNTIPRICTIHFGPEPGDERRNKKPEVCGGCRIWFYAGSAPADPGGADGLPWVWLADDSNSPYTHNLGTPQVVSYRAQWFDRLYHLGPLGDVFTCTVTG